MIRLNTNPLQHTTMLTLTCAAWITKEAHYVHQAYQVVQHSSCALYHPGGRAGAQALAGHPRAGNTLCHTWRTQERTSGTLIKRPQHQQQLHRSPRPLLCITPYHGLTLPTEPHRQLITFDFP